MKIQKTLCILFCLMSALLCAQTAPVRVEFPEIWAYLMNGDEQFLDASFPITDLGYFGAGINTYGKLSGVPDIGKIAFFTGKKHLVIAEGGNLALTHFCIDPQYPVREALLQAILAASVPYDGIQIDFEAVPAADRENFISFLSRLKLLMGRKILSVALPARTRTIDEPYDYLRIGRIADRIIIMAYDEHWSGGSPGSIASLAWCEKVVLYAVSKIGTDKLVMGVPFYGRAWSDTNPAKAYKHSSISQLVADKKIATLNRENEIPFFQYQETVNVQVYFEDVFSILSRLKIYKNATVRNISFWKLGQEDFEIWNNLVIQK